MNEQTYRRMKFLRIACMNGRFFTRLTTVIHTMMAYREFESTIRAERWLNSQSYKEWAEILTSTDGVKLVKITPKGLEEMQKYESEVRFGNE